jgi:hypothetical protein
MKAKSEIDTLRLYRWILPIACALALVAPGMLSAQSALAQDATPEPVVCDLPARPITFIADLLAAPKPETSPTPVAEIPDGTDVTNSVVRDEVSGLVKTLITCVNQGELLRSFSLFDDEYLRRLIDPDGLMSAEVAIEIAKSMATPSAADPEDVTVLDEILLIRDSGDGSVVVVFRTRGGPDRDQDETQVDLYVLRKSGDEWRIIDGLADLDPEAIPIPTT